MTLISTAREVLRRTWVRRTLVVGLSLGIALVTVGAVGATGGVVLRDDDGCPRTIGSFSSVSWADVLHIEGRTYERVDIVAPHESRIDQSQLAGQLGTIKCTTADDVQDPGYDLRDGEATFLEPGTPVHALAGTNVSFRVAVVDDGEPVVYENRPFTGTVGADLLPFPAEDVVAVTFLSEFDGRTVLGQLTESDTVREFVEDLQAAPVGDRPDLGEEPRVFVALEFADQPPTTLVTYPAHGITTAGLQLSEAILELIPPPANR
ncbi:MAG: hypothetical protein WD532_10710 [Acidimicrobiia bacterium]